MTTFLDELKRARAQSGLSGRDLGSRMRWLADGYTSMVEAGRRKLSLDDVPRLAGVLGLDAKGMVKLYLADYHAGVFRLLFGATRPAAPGSGKANLEVYDLADRIARLPGKDRDLIEGIVDRLAAR